MAPHLDQSPTEREDPTSFAETALKLGGKSDDEARRTGAIDGEARAISPREPARHAPGGCGPQCRRSGDR